MSSNKCSRFNPSVYLYSALVQLLGTLMVDEDITLVLCHKFNKCIKMYGTVRKSERKSHFFCTSIELDTLIDVCMGMQCEEVLNAHRPRTIAISQLETDFNTSCSTHVHEGYINKVVDSKRSRVQMLSRL